VNAQKKFVYSVFAPTEASKYRFLSGPQPSGIREQPTDLEFNLENSLFVFHALAALVGLFVCDFLQKKVHNFCVNFEKPSKNQFGP
jgi:hypothetical protein